jgi:hypothetical protein
MGLGLGLFLTQSAKFLRSVVCIHPSAERHCKDLYYNMMSISTQAKVGAPPDAEVNSTGVVGYKVSRNFRRSDYSNLFEQLFSG